MGFLEIGTPLTWEESASVKDLVKEHGLKQLLHVWNLNKSRYDGCLRWGEEVEFSLVDLNSDTSEAKIYADASEMIEELSVRERIRPKLWTQPAADWHPEFANHMIEAIPSPPYPLNLNSILALEHSMRLRRAKIQSLLPPHKFVTSQTAFPRFGLGNFVASTLSITDTNDSATGSIFIPDNLINPHPRFPTLVKNITSRRGAKPFITIPVYKDIHTFFRNRTACDTTSINKEGDWTKSVPIETLNRFNVEQLALQTINPVKDYIYMDSFAFGMGMSCVQTTFACPDISSARYLYDQLLVLAPLFLALTAATPILRGLLADTDTRWSTLEQAVDCRTKKEMDYIPKSRYSGASLYISDRQPLLSNLNDYNNTNPPINTNAEEFLVNNGMDSILSKHFSHLWIRDPMVIFAEKVHLDPTKSIDHFENIQSTNWNSVRFKPPPPLTKHDQIRHTDDNPGHLGPIGWRVEFRSPEIQLTDYDNAAGVAFITVLAQMITALDLDLYIPMIYNDINMERSWKRDAINNEKFYFRKDISSKTTQREVVEMTLTEILIGSSNGFKGLIPLCQDFMLREINAGRCGSTTQHRFNQYIDLFIKRSKGELMTNAQYIRSFVLSHPLYTHDSIVHPTICYDLTVLSTNVGFGILTIPKMHGLTMAQCILQTPLPSTTVLPFFSKDLIKSTLYCCIECDSIKSIDMSQHNGTDTFEIIVHETSHLQCNHLTSLQTSPFFFIKNRMVVLNNIDSIYTMPIGVMSRIGGTSRHLLKEHDSSDLFDMTYEELVRVATGNDMSTVPSSKQDLLQHADNPMISSPTAAAAVSTNCGLHKVPSAQCLNPLLKQTPFVCVNSLGAISSEDFTRSWISKGLDDLDFQYSELPSSLKKRLTEKHLFISNQPGIKRTTLCGTTTYSGGKLYDIQTTVSDTGITERLSTVCPSSVGGFCECEVGDDLIHELSRSLSLGFDTEEDLEYFKQVCDWSA